jgi:hypothetical protein
MATRKFRPAVAATSDVWTFTVGTFSNNTVIGVTCNDKTLSRTCGSGETATTAAAALHAILLSSTIGEFAEYLWTVAGAVVTATAKTAGIPGTFAAAGTSGAVTASNAVAATGPQFGNVAANWGGSLPADDDVLILDNFSPSLTYGLSVLDGVSGLTIILDNFGGSIGLPPVVSTGGSYQPSGGSTYFQYRPQYLLINAGDATIDIGRGTTVPTRVAIQLGGDANAIINVYGASAPTEGEQASVFIHGTTSHTALNVTQGAVAVAYEYGQGGGFDVVRIGSESNSGNDALVIFGAGATVPLIVNQAGRSRSAANVTSLTMQERAMEHQQTAGTLAATVSGGRIAYESDGSLTVVASGAKTVVDFTGDVRPKTFTGTCAFRGGAALNDPAGTWATGSVTFDSASLRASTLGQDSSISRS